MALPASVLLYGYLFGISSLFYPAFPTRKSKVWCLCRGPPFTSRYGRLCLINGSLLHTTSCRSFDPSKQPVFRYMGILPDCCSGTAFCPYLSFPGRRRHGQTVTHSACAVRRASGMSQAERVSFLFARQTVSFTHPSRHSFYQMPFIQAAGQFLFYLRLLPAVIPCLPPHRFYRVRM